MHLLARQVAGAELPVSLEHISITGWVHLIFKDHKSTAKVSRRAAAKNMCLAPQRISDTPRSAPYALAATRFTRSSLKNNFQICQTVLKPRMFADAMDRRGICVEG